MSIIPEIRYDSAGNPTGVFLTMEQWEELAGQIETAPVEKWEKDLITQRAREHQAAPEECISWNDLRQQMIQEDGPL